jgi:serine/threonine protein kinase
MVTFARAKLFGDEFDSSAADTWCCGVVLYCMLVGRFPFQTDGEHMCYTA